MMYASHFYNIWSRHGHLANNAKKGGRTTGGGTPYVLRAIWRQLPRLTDPARNKSDMCDAHIDRLLFHNRTRYLKRYPTKETEP